MARSCSRASSTSLLVSQRANVTPASAPLLGRRCRVGATESADAEAERFRSLAAQWVSRALVNVWRRHARVAPPEAEAFAQVRLKDDGGLGGLAVEGGSASAGAEEKIEIAIADAT